MSHNELKRFFFAKPPTGIDIANLVRDNNLEGWRVDIERKYAENQNGLALSSQYRWEITFERTIS